MKSMLTVIIINQILNPYLAKMWFINTKKLNKKVSRQITSVNCVMTQWMDVKKC